jgi:hypothetical protein
MRVQWRQGDVLFERVPGPFTGLEPRAGEILFTGEATGHSHRVAAPGSAEIFMAGTFMYLKVGAAGTSIVHEEHKPIELEEGFYRVWRQREYDARWGRSVAD